MSVAVFCRKMFFNIRILFSFLGHAASVRPGGLEVLRLSGSCMESPCNDCDVHDAF